VTTEPQKSSWSRERHAVHLTTSVREHDWIEPRARTSDVNGKTSTTCPFRQRCLRWACSRVHRAPCHGSALSWHPYVAQGVTRRHLRAMSTHCTFHSRCIFRSKCRQVVRSQDSDSAGAQMSLVQKASSFDPSNTMGAVRSAAITLPFNSGWTLPNEPRSILRRNERL